MRRVLLSLVMTALCLTLGGCDITGNAMRDYDESEAASQTESAMKTMEEWMSVNCPQGKIVSMDNIIRKQPGISREELSSYVGGDIFDGRKQRGYLLKCSDGSVYLEPDMAVRQRFQRSCLDLVKECLEIEDITEDEEDRDSEILFYTSLGADSDTNLYRMFDGYSDGDYVKLPGALVMSGADVEDYVRDADRGDVIYISIRGLPCRMT